VASWASLACPTRWPEWSPASMHAPAASMPTVKGLPCCLGHAPSGQTASPTTCGSSLAAGQRTHHSSNGSTDTSARPQTTKRPAAAMAEYAVQEVEGHAAPAVTPRRRRDLILAASCAVGMNRQGSAPCRRTVPPSRHPAVLKRQPPIRPGLVRPTGWLELGLARRPQPPSSGA